MKQSVDSHTSETGLQTQYSILSQVTPDPDDVINETAQSHTDKNRSDKYLPGKVLLNISQWMIHFISDHF